MTALLRDRRGATSVLVIFMMIVLVVFAVLAFTTAYANYRLSQKTAQASVENYALDDQAFAALMKIDASLANAEITAQQILLGDMLPSQGAAFTAEQVLKITHARGQEAALPDLMTRLYMQSAYRQLDELNQSNSGIRIRCAAPYEDGDFLDFTRPTPTAGVLQASIALTGGDAPGDKQLDVLIDIAPPAYSLRLVNGSVQGERQEETGRYEIAQWRQWQIPFAYDDTLQFGDVRIEPGN